MGIGGGSVLVPWRPAFWIAAEVVEPPASVPCVAGKRPLGLPFGVVARFLFPLPLHLSPYSQEY